MGRKEARRELRGLKVLQRQFEHLLLLQNYVTMEVLLYFSDVEQYQRFLRVVRDDEELRDYTTRGLTMIQREYKTLLMNIHAWQKWWKELLGNRMEGSSR